MDYYSEGLYDLCNAVIEQAAKDYMKLLKRRWIALNKCDMHTYRHLKWEVDSLENYFGSEDYKFYTKLDGQFLRAECYKKAFLEFRKTIDKKNKRRKRRKAA